MKADVLDVDGKKMKEIDLPSCFSEVIRRDIVMKVLEAQKVQQPYAPYLMAGKQASASGKIRHGRRKWRTAYGKGISRVPRKIMWRRGDQFYWIGAEISGSRKGRRAHPPKILSMLRKRKINKKEMSLALRSVLSATAHPDYVQSRYERIGEVKMRLPLIVDSKLLTLKNKDLKKALEKMLGDLFSIVLQEKSVRAGKGKLRGRKYKKTAGLLLVIGDKERASFQGIDIKTARSVSISDLAPGNLGRLTLYTEQAIQDLGKRISANTSSGERI